LKGIKACDYQHHTDQFKKTNPDAVSHLTLKKEDIKWRQVFTTILQPEISIHKAMLWPQAKHK